MRRVSNFLIFIALIFVFSFGASGELVNFKNKYLSLFVDDMNYRFTLQRENLPSKDYSRDLLFYNVPPTSYVSFLVGNLAYRPNEGNIIKPLSRDGNSLSFSIGIGGVVFSVSFSFVKNGASLVEDALEISVDFTNVTNVSLNTGIRFLLDTIFGEDNPSLPKFYLDGKTPIDYELLITRDNMISYIVSTSDIDGVNRLFIHWYGNTPTRILFSNWRKLDITDWYSEPSTFLKYRFSENSSPDCAVAIFFEGIEIKPSESKNIKVVLALNSYYPYVQKEEPKPSVAVPSVPETPKAVEEPKVSETPTPKESVVFVTNFVYLTNEVREVKEEVKTQEVIKELPRTNEVVITNVISEKRLVQDEEIVRRISNIKEKIEKLSSSMDFVLSQLTNKGKALDKKEEEDVDRIKKLKIAMAKLSRTMDTITERVAIINEYINIRKKFSDKRVIVYSEEEYRRDLKMIEEISKELDEVIEILKRLRKKF
jgi:hypothetical protein